jgi:RNA polymerase sigma-70 factor (ECF subfamily)
MSALAPAVALGSTDPELLSRIAAGDLESLGTLYDRYARDVRTFLLRLGVRQSELDDVVQQSFLEVVRAAKNFDGRPCARPWLLGVSATMVRRGRRSFARTVSRLKLWTKASEGARPVTPAESLEGEEARLRAAAALDALSDSKREAFVLVVLEGASGEEAAAALGVSVNTIWTRVHHARAELRAKLLGDDS